MEVRAELEALGCLAHSAPTSVGALPLGADALLPRARTRSYREPERALTESAKALLPRARTRSYRECESALTESPKTLLPRARTRSYREPECALTEGVRPLSERLINKLLYVPDRVPAFALIWGLYPPSLGGRYIRPWNRAYLPYSPREGLGGELEQGGGSCPLGKP